MRPRLILALIACVLAVALAAACSAAVVTVEWTAKSTAFKDLKSGRTFKLSFDLVRTVKGAAIPEGVRMAAEIALAQAGHEARYQIKTIARSR